MDQDKTRAGSHNETGQTTTGETTPEPELYVVLSDNTAVAALAISWVALLVALIWTQIRYRRLRGALDELTG